MAVQLDLVVHGKWPDSVLQVGVAESLGRSGAIVGEVVVGHHRVLGITAGLEVRNSNSWLNLFKQFFTVSRNT